MEKRERNVQVVVIDFLLGYIMMSAASTSVMVPTNDSQIYIRRSGFDTYTQ